MSSFVSACASPTGAFARGFAVLAAARTLRRRASRYRMKPYLTGLIVAVVPALVGLACNNNATVDGNTAAGSAESLAEDELPAFIAEAQCDQQLSCDCYLEAGPVGEDPAAWTRNQCI